MRTIEQKVYSFDELSEDVQQKVIEKNHDINIHDDWYECITESYKEGNKYFEVDNIYFRGFWSQGDGAMFEYNGIKQELFDEFIDSLDLSPMRKGWLENNICTSGKGNHRGHYYHENCCNHAIYWEVDNGDLHWSDNLYQWLESFEDEFESFVIDKYKDICQYLYRDLEQHYEYLTSEEMIVETIEYNEYEFFENGDML